MCEPLYGVISLAAAATSQPDVSFQPTSAAVTGVGSISAEALSTHNAETAGWGATFSALPVVGPLLDSACAVWRHPVHALAAAHATVGSLVLPPLVRGPTVDATVAAAAAAPKSAASSSSAVAGPASRRPVHRVALHPQRSLAAVLLPRAAASGMHDVAVYDLACTPPRRVATLIGSPLCEGARSIAWKPGSGFTLAIGSAAGLCLWRLDIDPRSGVALGADTSLQLDAVEEASLDATTTAAFAALHSDANATFNNHRYGLDVDLSVDAPGVGGAGRLSGGGLVGSHGGTRGVAVIYGAQWHLERFGVRPPLDHINFLPATPAAVDGRWVAVGSTASNSMRVVDVAHPPAVQLSVGARFQSADSELDPMAALRCGTVVGATASGTVSSLWVPLGGAKLTPSTGTAASPALSHSALLRAFRPTSGNSGIEIFTPALSPATASSGAVATFVPMEGHVLALAAAGSAAPLLSGATGGSIPGCGSGAGNTDAAAPVVITTAPFWALQCVGGRAATARARGYDLEAMFGVAPADPAARRRERDGDVAVADEDEAAAAKSGADEIALYCLYGSVPQLDPSRSMPPVVMWCAVALRSFRLSDAPHLAAVTYPRAAVPLGIAAIASNAFQRVAGAVGKAAGGAAAGPLGTHELAVTLRDGRTIVLTVDGTRRDRLEVVARTVLAAPRAAPGATAGLVAPRIDARTLGFGATRVSGKQQRGVLGYMVGSTLHLTTCA